MNCMKCGREVKNEQSFCPLCLEGMEAYPVRPGTVVQLPKRQEPSPLRKVMSRRKPLTPEQRIQRMRKRILRLQLLLLACFIAIGLLVYPYVMDLLDIHRILPGQEYTTITSTEAVETQSP